MQDQPCPYVSRGGLKLAAALRAFGQSAPLDPRGMICADLGASTGGFTDCLLQHGAARVFAVDTAYGQLAWKLRQDPRVTVLERSNALHLDPHSLDGFDGVDLVTVDLGWTRQQFSVPAALRWLRRAEVGDARGGWIISLIKPHYEADEATMAAHGTRGVLDEPAAQRVLERVLAQMPALGVRVVGQVHSPILGSGKGGGHAGRGNVEYLALLRREARSKA